ncbi:hypothetical protein [Demetria terragena]|uniref:hypothetical protein n=1 Tax=Demetria terragena TaxID=63959 RepID=UPI00035FE225|nr:hypothetical protein [Demetria terragena]
METNTNTNSAPTKLTSTIADQPGSAIGRLIGQVLGALLLVALWSATPMVYFMLGLIGAYDVPDAPYAPVVIGMPMWVGFLIWSTWRFIRACEKTSRPPTQDRLGTKCG